jgi:hypothetical protein
MRKPRGSHSRRVCAFVVAASWVFYVTAYAPIAAVVGDGVAILTILPVMMSAWAFGEGRMRPETRVLLLTGFGDMMHADNREHADIDLIVGKPVTATHLRQAIKEVASTQP